MSALIALLIVVAPFTSALPYSVSPHTTPETYAVIERGIFSTPLSGFVSFEKRTRRSFPELDWSSDFCSSPLVGNTGRSFDFTMPCRRHDFGYRNLKLLDVRTGIEFWNEDVRTHVDDQFRRDLATCSRRPFSQRFTCRTWAAIYFRTVRAWGS